MRTVLITALLLSTAARAAAPVADLVVQVGHSEGANRYAFNESCMLLAAAGDTESSVKLWDLRSQRLVRTIGRDQPSEIALSPDCETLAVLNMDHRQTSGSIDLFATRSGERIDHLRIDTATEDEGPRMKVVFPMAFTRDGAALVTSPKARALYRYTLGDPDKKLKLLARAPEPFHIVVYSPSGGPALLVGEAWVALVDLTTGKIGPRVAHALGYPSAWAFSPDGSHLVGGGSAGRGPNIHYFEAATLQELSSFELKAREGYFPPPAAPQLTSGGDLLVNGWGWLLRIDAASGALRSKLEWPGTHWPAFTPDGRLELRGTGKEKSFAFQTIDTQTGEAVDDFSGAANDAPALSVDARGRLLGVVGAQTLWGMVDPTAESRVFDLSGASEEAHARGNFNGFSPSGRYVLLGDFPYDLEKGEVVRLPTLPDEGIRVDQTNPSFGFSPGDKYLAIGMRRPADYPKKEEQLVAVWDLQSRTRVSLLPLPMRASGPSWPRPCTFSGDEKHISCAMASMAGDGLPDAVFEVATGKPAPASAVAPASTPPVAKKKQLSTRPDGTVVVSDAAGNTLVTVLRVGSQFGMGGNFLLFTPDGYFMGQRGAGKYLAVRVGLRAYPIDNFDLALNRPDVVLERLGTASPEVLQRLRDARKRRLEKAGLTAEPAAGIFELAEVRIGALPAATRAQSIQVPFTVRAGAARPLLLQVRDNGVPIFAGRGQPLSAFPDRLVEVPLARGMNRLRLTVLDDRGGESVDERAFIAREAAPREPDLYALAIGVSAYADKRFQLKYAAKDAKDLLRTLEALAHKRGYGKVHVKAVLDGEATRAGALASRAFLETAGIDDVVLVFAAGHGLLDDKARYWFGTVDLDFEKPETRGLSFEDMEGLVSGLAARRKLMLIDTCAAGETDEEEVERAAGNAQPGVLVASRGVKLAASSAKTGARSTLLLARDLFSTLRQGSGTHVIGSSSGVEFAFESGELKNGVFTSALLEILGRLETWAPETGTSLRVSSLQRYLGERVNTLTSFKQHPIAREANPEGDFTVWAAPPEKVTQQARTKKRKKK